MERDLGGYGRIFAVHEYRSPRTHKDFGEKDKPVREAAMALVSPQFHERVLREVAKAMTAVLRQSFVPPINLIPAPNHLGSTQRMTALCAMIREEFGDGVWLQNILEGDPHQSMCERHRLESRPLELSQIRVRVKKAKRHARIKNAVVVDNVVTSGTTYLSCRDAIRRTCEVVGSFGDDVDLLVWGDARGTLHEAYRRV